MIYDIRYDDYNYHKFPLKRARNTSLNRPVIRKINYKTPDFTAKITKKGKKKERKERKKETLNKSAHLIQTAVKNNNKTATDVFNAAVNKSLRSSSSFSKCHTASRYTGICNFIYAPQKIKSFSALASRKSYMMNTITCTSHTKFHQNRAKNVESEGIKAFSSLSEDDCADFHETPNHSIP